MAPGLLKPPYGKRFETMIKAAAALGRRATEYMARDAKRAVKVYLAVWVQSSSAGEKSGKEGAMFEVSP
ncbi:hypothetical protein ACU4GD_16070 [Cupriavidus basilensis]